MLTITAEAINQALRDLTDRLPHEGCGIFYGKTDASIEGYLPLPNVSVRPERAFQVDPREWVAAVYRLERRNHRLIGFIHSHPNGEIVPSRSDLAEGWHGFPSYWICAPVPGREPFIGAYREENGGYIPLPYDVRS